MQVFKVQRCSKFICMCCAYVPVSAIRTWTCLQHLPCLALPCLHIHSFLWCGTYGHPSLLLQATSHVPPSKLMSD